MRERDNIYFRSLGIGVGNTIILTTYCIMIITHCILLYILEIWYNEVIIKEMVAEKYKKYYTKINICHYMIKSQRSVNNETSNFFKKYKNIGYVYFSFQINSVNFGQ